MDIIAQGMNSLKGHHAEVSALLDLQSLHASKQALVVDLLVVRVDDKGELRMSKPCPQCQQALKSSGQKIRHVYFSDNGYLIQTRFEEL